MQKKFRIMKAVGPPFHIQALRAFPGVEYGEIGGVVESEDNLSHDGHCWISFGGKALGDSRVIDNARVGMNVTLSGKAILCGHASARNAIISGETTRIGGLSTICGEDYKNVVTIRNAVIDGTVVVCGRAFVCGTVKDGIEAIPKITGDVLISDCAQILDRAKLSGTAVVCGTSVVQQHAIVSGQAIILDGVITGTTQVSGITMVKSIFPIKDLNLIDVPELVTSEYLRRTYGLTIEDFDEFPGISVIDV